MELNLIQKIAIWALPVLFAITAHEAAHAYVAKKFGDPTAYLLGRVTFNPLKHIDPVGTILLPLIFLILPGGFLFGWAKPVPVDFGRLKKPKQDMLWVAAAGPAANFVMAIIWGLFFKLAEGLDGNSFQLPLAYMSQAGISINVSLMVLNLIPLPPLDGGRILLSLLPNHLAVKLALVEPYGMFVLIGLLATGVLGSIMAPFMALAYRLIHFIV
ncbi:site-2 protease family protein [Iodobacter sp. LRB]|uniref:site-2 protease family protein n=1 Tax=unclassified Iodobacter TaxID=235634 RepID=UPI000C118335|nr:site-2 protease family protein [Iodobacter sp. BJB302]PHV01335.1 site-2 protease family protein [Iodobacter sp. BJB302]